jgi:hypothetical protein
MTKRKSIGPQVGGRFAFL